MLGKIFGFWCVLVFGFVFLLTRFWGLVIWCFGFVALGFGLGWGFGVGIRCGFGWSLVSGWNLPSLARVGFSGFA